jgi:hypothetical protein
VNTAIRLASLLEPGLPEIQDIVIGWKDGLPEDEKEKVDSEVAKRNAGLTSLVSSIMRLENMEREEAEKEVERIQEEQQANAQSLGGEDFASGTRALVVNALRANSSRAGNGAPPTEDEIQ